MMLGAPDVLNASVLIVDDQEPNIRLLERVLSETGYANVSSTKMPREVAALHRTHHYDLILLDLQMPSMDGFEVMTALRADDDESYLPVIVLTAQPAHKLRALQAGAKDFISKPFDLIEVKTRIHNMLEVRLLYRRLERHTEELERAVAQRTAELRASETRFRRLTELASDWYWEQNETGAVTQVSGPVEEMLGIGMSAFLGDVTGGGLNRDDKPAHHETAWDETGWDKAERSALQTKIATRQPFLDFAFSRVDADGSTRHFRVSGEPMFDDLSRFTGYRGIGSEMAGALARQPGDRPT